jgi:hypothetical protein
MSGVDQITSIVDIPAIQGELNTVSKGIADLVAQIQAVKKVGVEISGAKSATELSELNKQLQTNVNLTNQAATAAINESTALANLSKTTKDLTGTIDQNIKLQARYRIELQQISSEMKLLEKTTTNAEKTTGRYRNQVGELLKRQNELKQAQSEITASLKNQIKEQNAAGGSVDALRARYNLLIKTFDSLSDAERKSTAGQTIKLEAAGISNELKSLEGTTGRFQRNVGNYSNAIVDTFKKGFAGLRTLANIIPGLGISGLLLLLVKPIQYLIESFSGLSKAQSQLNSIGKESVRESISQRTELNLLYKSANDVSKSTKDRLDSVKKLQEKFPGYFEDIKTEKDLNDKLTVAYDNATTAILSKAKATAAFNKIVENENKILELKERREKIASGLNKGGLLGNIKDFFTSPGVGGVGQELISIKSKIEELEAINLKLSEFALFDEKKAPPSSSGGSGDRLKELKAEADALLQALFKLQEIQLRQTIDFNKEIADNDKKTLFERLAALRVAKDAEEEIALLKADLDKKLGKKTAAELQVIEAEKLDAILRINRKFINDRQKIKDEDAKAQIAEEKALTDALTKGIEERYKKWKANEDRMAKDKKEYDDKAKKDAEDLAKRKLELEKQLTQELIALSFTLLTANLERQKNELQGQIDAVEKRKQQEIELANQTIVNTQDRAAAIAVIEARAAAQREQLERKQRDLDIKKAQFDKAQSIARIVQETAIQVIKNLTSPLLPLIIGIGAAQLATVIATPIPRYKDGGEHDGGPMIVGDGGKSEGIVFPDGTTMKSPATDTLMTAPAGTVIYPDFNKMMLNSTMTKPVEFKAKSVSDTSIVKELKEVKKAINKIPQQNVTVANILSQRVRNGSGYNNHLRRES